MADSHQRRQDRRRPADRPKLRKRFGQHHLRDSSLCRPLVEDLQPQGRLVIEIGPGGGVLTMALLDRGARVWAFELDREWAFFLAGRRRRDEQLSVAVVDASRFDWQQLPPRALVAGNLPFNVATKILTSILPHHRTIETAAFMVQKEVAERLTAVPGTKAYGSLSVIAAAYSKISWLGTVSPGSFVPPPKVAAAYVSLRLEPPPLASSDMHEFVRFVRAAFAQRRKTIANNLAQFWNRSRATSLLETVGIDGTNRAENLPLEDFVALFEANRVAGTQE